MKLLLTSVLFALFPFLASAIPITSGTITFSGFSIGDFNFSGPDFSVSGGMYLGNWGPATCRPCNPGSSLGVNGTQVGGDFASGSATVGGTSFPFVAWGSGANILPPGVGSEFDVSGPDITLDAGPGTYHSTFTFGGLFGGGSLCGIVNRDPLFRPQPCDVDLRGLTGSGIVDVTVSAGGGALDFTSAVYTFTPEPQTWMLALVGIVAIAGWSRNRAGRARIMRGSALFSRSRAHSPAEPGPFWN